MHTGAAICSMFGLILAAGAYDAPVTWSRGSAAVLQVALVDGQLSYNVSLGAPAQSWLCSAPGPPRAHCGGHWRAFSTLRSASQWSFTHPQLGAADALSTSWAPASDNGQLPLGCGPMNLTFVYYAEVDALEFRTSFPDGMSDTGGTPQPPCSWCKSLNSTSAPLSEFPRFMPLHELGYLEWAGAHSHNLLSFGRGLENFHGGRVGGPLVLHDVSSGAPAHAADALVLSTFNQHLVGILNLQQQARAQKPVQTRTQAQTEALVAGVQPGITSLPAGYALSFCVVASRGRGVSAGVAAWGRVLRRLSDHEGAKRKTNDEAHDLANNVLGYWTDNGGYFYGNNPLDAATAPTLFDDLVAADVPIGYVQLDPWAWRDYVKSAQIDIFGRKVWIGAGDMRAWQADPAYFPGGDLGRFSREVARVPLMLYTLFWGADASAAYPNISFVPSYPQRDYKTLGTRLLKQPAPADSYALHDTIMTAQSPQMRAFEVDFLDWTIFLFPDFVENTSALWEWASGMNRAALKNNVSIQYCMDLPAWAMTSLDFAAVTNARGSDDNFPSAEDGPDAGPGQPTTRWKLAYSTLFYAGLGLEPFFDVLWTTANQTGHAYPTNRSNIELQAMVSALASRGVGIGDGPGQTNATLARRFAMSNGTLLHPTTLAQPLDRTYSGFAGQPSGVEVWVASTVASGAAAGSAADSGAEPSAVAAWQILAVDVDDFKLQRSDLWPRAPVGAKLAAYRLDDGACTGFNTTQASKCVAPFGETEAAVRRLHAPRTRDSPAAQAEHSFESHIVVPVCASGAALLGEPAKFTAVSHRRFSALRCTASGLEVGVHGAPHEIITVALLLGGAQGGALSSVEIHFDEQGGLKSVVCNASKCALKSDLA